MGDPIPHAPHVAPGNRLMRTGEIAVLVHDPGRGLADDDEAHDDRQLGSLVDKEVILAHALDKAPRILRGRPHLIEIVAKPAFGHIGLAVAN